MGSIFFLKKKKLFLIISPLFNRSLSPLGCGRATARCRQMRLRYKGVFAKFRGPWCTCKACMTRELFLLSRKHMEHQCTTLPCLGCWTPSLQVIGLHLSHRQSLRIPCNLLFLNGLIARQELHVIIRRKFGKLVFRIYSCQAQVSCGISTMERQWFPPHNYLLFSPPKVVPTMQ